MSNLLYIHWNIDPVMFSLGPLSIRWYSLLFVSGFIYGWFIFRHFYRREGVDESLLDPLLYAVLIGTIVGARLGHCLFYDFGYYFGSWEGFLEVFMPWKGGLASHGGAVGVILASFWYAGKYGKKNGFDALWVMDRLVIVTAFAGACIRIGNFFNSEIYGVVTDLPWGVIFERRGETLPKHPVQLYEAITYIILGIVLVWLYNRKLDKMYCGTFLGVFFIGCFGIRSLLEFIKDSKVTDVLGVTMKEGQFLSIPFIIAGILLLIYAYRKKIPARAVPPRMEKKPKETTRYARPVNKDGK